MNDTEAIDNSGLVRCVFVVVGVERQNIPREDYILDPFWLVEIVFGQSFWFSL